jgi:hypothetical protein
MGATAPVEFEPTVSLPLTTGVSLLRLTGGSGGTGKNRDNHYASTYIDPQ